MILFLSVNINIRFIDTILPINFSKWLYHFVFISILFIFCSYTSIIPNLVKFMFKLVQSNN